MEKQFAMFHVGDRVSYTGVTSYTNWSGRKVFSQTGTIIAVGNSVSIEMDDYRKPYYSRSEVPSIKGSYIIPQKQYANISLADLVTGEKKIAKL